MKKEPVFFSMVLLLLIFLSGCEGIDFSGLGIGSGKEFNPEVHKGNQGLVVEIIDNSPPSQLYEDENFKVVARLINKGAYEISSGILLLNYEKEFVDLQGDRKKIFNLEGKDVYNLWDDEEVLTFDMKTKLLDIMSKKHTSLITLTGCYDYETIASFQVCIDTNIYQTRPEEESVCTVRDQTSSGQGGPLIVSRVEEDISGGGYIIPQFKIYIENTGEGDIVRYGKKEQACASTGIEAGDYEVVDIIDVELSDYKLSKGQIKCSPGEIKLTEEKGILRCYLNVNDIKSTDSSFVTSLKIHLRYGYTQTESKYVDILDDISKEGRSISIEEIDSGGESSGSSEIYGDCFDSKGRYLGICQDISKSCEGGYLSGYCPGGGNIKCCVKANCFDEYSSNKCKVKSETDCSGNLYWKAGYCPGPADVQCCVRTGVPTET